MDTHYDLIVIGAGPAGTPAAIAAAQFGKKVLLVDEREAPGGECLFEGCIPSKVLENAANRYACIATSQAFHIEKNNPQIDWEAVLEDKAAIIKQRSMGAMMQIEQLPTLEYKQATATFEDTHTLRVGTTLYSFDKALIATGAKSTIANITGDGVADVWTNKEIFLQKKLPKELLFIGGGAISCELAQMFQKLGVSVHILQRGKRILNHLSDAAATEVANAMQAMGIRLTLEVQVESITRDSGQLCVKFLQNNMQKLLCYDHVVMATGRLANVENLALHKSGITYDKRGVMVNEYLQTSQPHIFACGDVIDAPKFAHTASYEASIVVHNMFAPALRSVDYDKNSWVLFTQPQVAVAGLNEMQCREKAKDIEVGIYEYLHDARAQLDKNTQGYLKYIIDKKTGVILGVEIVHADAASLAGEAALIVANELRVEDIVTSIHPHPTLTEGFTKLAQQIFFRAMMQRKSRSKQEN